MAKKSRDEDADVRLDLETGAQSVEWVRQEFASADLSGKRLNRRLVKTAEHSTKVSRHRRTPRQGLRLRHFLGRSA